MSYINLAITHTYAGGFVPPRSTTLEAGFSREGGRLEHLQRIAGVDGAPVKVTEYDPSTVPAEAAHGLLDATLGAGGVRQVQVEHGDGAQPSLVTWSDRFGTKLGSAFDVALPAPVQAILDAAELVQRAIDAAPIAR